MRSYRAVRTLGRILESFPASETIDRTRTHLFSSIQKRTFLSFPGSEEEGKTHHERRRVDFTPEQLFDVVADVDSYREFVPWCQGSRVLSRKDEHHFEAELEVGFKVFVERYTTRVRLDRPHLVECKVDDSHLFTYLDSTWRFVPGERPGTTLVDFRVDFCFRSPVYRQAVSLFFKEVVESQLRAFEDRCYSIYGTGIREEW